MANKPNRKLKLLYVLDILKNNTDESHKISADEICEILESYGIESERKSVYNDIEALIDYGYDIVYSKSEPRGYFLAYREFETPEVFLLCDAVQSADFISPKKTRELLNKLDKLVSKNEAKKNRRRVFIDNRTKSENEQTYINIDVISRALDENKQVKLSYVRHVFEEGKVKENIKVFQVSPYALTWVEDHYYLICNNKKYDNLMHLRVDRIKSAECVKEKARHFSEVSDYKNVFDVADYTGKAFNMFGGEKCTIEFLCENNCLEQIIDRFGKSISPRKYDENHFTFLTQALVSEGLVNWILEYSDQIEVLKPTDLREKIIQKTKNILEKYN